MRLLAITLLALLGSASSLWAQSDPMISFQEPLPFSQRELVEALRLRNVEEPLPVVLVRAETEGVVVIVVGGKERRVTIGTQEGASAARLVALLSLDLFSPLPLPTEAAASSAVAAAMPPVAAVRRKSSDQDLGLVGAPATKPLWYLQASLASTELSLHGLDLAVGRHVSDSLLVFVRTGARRQFQRGNENMSHVPVQLGFGVDLLSLASLVRIRAHVVIGATFTRFATTLDDQSISDSSSRFSAGTGVSAAYRATDRIALVTSLESNGYQRVLRYQYQGEDLAQTPRIDWSASLGLELRWGNRL